MFISILFVIIFSLITGILYRMGGKGKPYSSWIRDWIAPFFTYGVLLVLWNPLSFCVIPYIISFGLLGLSLTTYHTWLNILLNKPKEDKYWFNWLATGIAYGLSSFPLLWCGISIWAILVRSLILGVLTMTWSERISRDWLEEGGRGFLITATTPILLL